MTDRPYLVGFLICTTLSVVALAALGWVCMREITFERSVQQYAKAGNLELLAIQGHGVLGIFGGDLVPRETASFAPREFTVLYQTKFSESEKFLARCTVPENGPAYCNEQGPYDESR